MKKERTLTQEYLECDGCKYVMGSDAPLVTVTVPFDYPMKFLRADRALVRADRTLEFHFHAIQARHDCFRYWAHNPQVMRDSLIARGLDEEQIDDFMAMMLYRQNSYSPGIEREKKSA